MADRGKRVGEQHGIAEAGMTRRGCRSAWQVLSSFGLLGVLLLALFVLRFLGPPAAARAGDGAPRVDAQEARGTRAPSPAGQATTSGDELVAQDRYESLGANEVAVPYPHAEAPEARAEVNLDMAQYLEAIAAEPASVAVAALLRERYSPLFVPELNSLHHNNPSTTRDWIRAIMKDPRTVRLMTEIRNATPERRLELEGLLVRASVAFLEGLPVATYTTGENSHATPGAAASLPLLLAALDQDGNHLDLLLALAEAHQGGLHESAPGELREQLRNTGTDALYGEMARPNIAALDQSLENLGATLDRQPDHFSAEAQAALRAYAATRQGIQLQMEAWLENSGRAPEYTEALLDGAAREALPWMDILHYYEFFVAPAQLLSTLVEGDFPHSSYHAFQLEVARRVTGRHAALAAP